MNVKTVEGLVGARANICLSDTAVNVYQQASQKGDTATMERALGYAGQMVQQAETCQSTADEGMKADAKEQSEKADADQKKIIEKRREEREELEARIESSQESKTDTLEISAEGKAALSEISAAGGTSTDLSASGAEELPPVVYTDSKEVHVQTEVPEAELSVLA